jgi:hypothetical protein
MSSHLRLEPGAANDRCRAHRAGAIARLALLCIVLGAAHVAAEENGTTTTAPSPPEALPPAPGILAAAFAAAAAAEGLQGAAGTSSPWNRRPVCASMFLKSDWQLTSKQRACDWLQNRLFSSSALTGAAWSAGVSTLRDSSSEAGDPFATRFARRYAQSAAKSSAAYLGALVAHEDPRVRPPYLVLKPMPRPRGFWPRTRRALVANFVSYRCLRACRTDADVDRQIALSRMLGALASGYAAEAWTWDRETSHRRALRGAATAYGSSFLSTLFGEFSPELSAFARATFGRTAGGK